MSSDPDVRRFSCPAPRLDHDTIQLAHGAGGRLSNDLIEQVILPRFSSPELDCLEDQAVVELPPGRVAVSTDTFVVAPIFFPGGDIGDLAVNGTVNDVAMSGARPLVMTVGLVLEEGLPLADLVRVLDSMARAADRADVRVVTGDTKVVPRGACDRLFINTTGLGVVPDGVSLRATALEPGDAVLISGTLADHGMAVMTQRDGLSFAGDIASDTAALHGLIAELVSACSEVRALRDPTRGGLATTLNEFAAASGVGILIDEPALPVRPNVRGACELLGIDPLHVANEGKLVAVVSNREAERALKVLQNHDLGREAVQIGTVRGDHPGMVVMRTTLGAERIIAMPVGDILPRIC